MRAPVVSTLLLLLPACGGVALDAEAPVQARIDLRSERPLSDAGPWLDPAWAPDGDRISVAGLRYQGLQVVSARGGELEPVPASAERSAFRHRWIDAEHILCPARGRHAALSFDVDLGGPVELERDHAHKAPVFVERDDVWLRRDGADPLRLTPGADRFLDPQLSPDGALLAVVGLASGLHVVDVESGLALFRAPGSTHPEWSPDGLWLFFERTVDDGHDLTDGDLWALSIIDGDQVRITDTPDAIELHPAVSPDGTQLAWVRDGALWVGDLVQEVSP